MESSIPNVRDQLGELKDLILSGLDKSSGDDAPRRRDEGGHLRDKKTPPMAPRDVKRPVGKFVPYDVVAEKAKWMKKGLPEKVLRRVMRTAVATTVVPRNTTT